MKNKCKLLPLILLCLLLLSGCGGGKEPSSDIQLGGKDPSSDIQLGEPFEFTSGLAEGALQVTVKSARRITDVSELPPPGDVFGVLRQLCAVGRDAEGGKLLYYTRP